MAIPPLQTGSTVTTQASPTSSRVVDTVSQVAGAAADVGKKLATGAAKMGADAILQQGAEVVEHKARHAFRLLVSTHLRTVISMLAVLPIIGPKIINSMVDKIYPYYKQFHPETQLTAHEIAKHLEMGKMEFLEDDFFSAAEHFVKSNLSAEDKVKMEQGDKLVILKAFGGKIYDQVKLAMSMTKEPGGLMKVLKSIANWIPFVNKLPDSIKPIAGGGVLAVGGIIALRMALKVMKWVFLIGGGLVGLKMFTGGKKHIAPEEATGEGFLAKAGGAMSKFNDIQKALAAARPQAHTAA